MSQACHYGIVDDRAATRTRLSQLEHAALHVRDAAEDEQRDLAVADERVAELLLEEVEEPRPTCAMCVGRWLRKGGKSDGAMAWQERALVSNDAPRW